MSIHTRFSRYYPLALNKSKAMIYNICVQQLGMVVIWWMESDAWYLRRGSAWGGFRSFAEARANGEVAPVPDLRSKTWTDEDAP
jgi:hypothetical protein